MPHFTPREQDVLRLLAQHYSYAEIGTTLGLKRSTLSSHMHNITAKTGVRTQLKLAGYAIDQGYGKDIYGQITTHS